MKGMSRVLNVGKSVSDNGWVMFSTFLKYKFEPREKLCQNRQLIIFFKEVFELRRSEGKASLSTYSCTCGHESDWDDNAAKKDYSPRSPHFEELSGGSSRQSIPYLAVNDHVFYSF